MVEDKKIDEYYPYDRFSDYRLPFGSCIGNTDADVYLDSCKKSMDSINYIRKHAESLTLESFQKLCPVLDKNNKTYKFLCNHINRVKLVSEGSCYFVSNGIIGEHSSWSEKEFKRDVEYGFSDVIFYVSFDVQYMKLIPHFYIGTFNHNYQYSIKMELISKFNPTSIYKSLNENEALSAICYLLDRSEFIPLRICKYDGVIISHKAYRDNFGIIHNAVQSPALGLNIKKYEKIMKGLESFISKGGRIIDNRLYLILENRNEKGTYYLRNYEKLNNKEESFNF